MIRRHFLKFVVLAGLGSMAIIMFNFSYVRKAFYRVQSLFSQPPEVPPESERVETTLSPEGPMVSVETALNSRCTSDDDNNPMNFHWGMFDTRKKLSQLQIENIIQYAVIPRFTKAKVQIRNDRNILTFTMDSGAAGIMREWVMVESGMQHQAVGLVCSALGIGYVFSNLGRDGTTLSEGEIGTVKIRVDPLKPGYSGSYWTDTPPEGSADGRNALPAPARNGAKPLLSVLRELKTEEMNGERATLERLSQLLWAARGRTPHYYKSTPWGMTIPTWGGEQDISDLSVVCNGILSRYINWRWSKWTHSLDTADRVSQGSLTRLLKGHDPFNCFVVLGRNENSGRVLWEIGYQLLNLMLQAKSLGLKYRAVLLNENQRETFKNGGIRDPIATLSILMEPARK
jgi:hypothetical protein